MKQNMARAHGKREWTITELWTVIRDELHILELGSHSEPNVSIPLTASFHSSVSKPTHTKSKIQCPFCKGPHTVLMCDQVNDPRKRISIVHQERLCFNCLGHHKISSCNSKHRCHNCRRKHHTSLCSADLQHTDSTTPAQSEAPKQQHNTFPQQPGDTPQPQQQRSATSQPKPVTPTNTSNDSSSFSVTIPLHQSVCLLKTAIGTIVHDSRNVEVKILLHEGSQRSFVTEDLVKSLALQPYSQEKINISSFSSTYPSSHTLDTFIVNLLAKSGETLQLSVSCTVYCNTFTEHLSCQCGQLTLPSLSSTSPSLY